ncbi:DDE-type integrase/transposase/recombinase [Labrys sp. La1]|uniref:DDE-type integrase/transposase/recombinase n=1 Tax=Labrys sp. La1 TaxID=3404917 RepID=UPI003EBF6AD6
MRKRRLRARDFSRWRWHLDEVFVKVNGELHYLWRAVDHEGEGLEFFVSKTRDKAGALRFLKKAVRRYDRPEIIVTDGLRSYSAAIREIGNLKRREVGQWKNNRAENSHQPFRRREAAMLKFRRTKTPRKFVAVHSRIYNHFNSERHLVSRKIDEQRRSAPWPSGGPSRPKPSSGRPSYSWPRQVSVSLTTPLAPMRSCARPENRRPAPAEWRGPQSIFQTASDSEHKHQTRN